MKTNPNHPVANCNFCTVGKSGFKFCSGNCSEFHEAKKWMEGFSKCRLSELFETPITQLKNLSDKKIIDVYRANKQSCQNAVSGSFFAYQTFLKAAVKELLNAERSIVKVGFVKISIDEEYKCSDEDLAKYKLEYKYPLHLIHFGQDLHRAELKLNDDLKRKWFVR